MPIETIADIKKEYFGKLDALDLDLLIAHILKKPREFVLAHPEKALTQKQAEKIENLAKRREKNEPLAYLTGKKEFYGLNFEVTPATLIPRPETEMLVEEALSLLRSMLRNKVHTNVCTSIIDVGTGSGNIIISIAKKSEPTWTFDVQMQKGHRMPLYGVDISLDALRVARRNAKKNRVAEKIKFLHGNLLEPFLKDTKYKIQDTRYIILANLPYLSKEIYAATEPDVKKFEPKSALYSKNHGLDHYEKLFQQMKVLKATRLPARQESYKLKAIIEFSPEQKIPLKKLVLEHFPASKIAFKKDLARRTRIAIISF